MEVHIDISAGTRAPRLEISDLHAPEPSLPIVMPNPQVMICSRVEQEEVRFSTRTEIPAVGDKPAYTRDVDFIVTKDGAQFEHSNFKH